MNKRIRELAEQSGFFPVPDETETDWEYRAENARYEKFAALIVKECIEICDKDYIRCGQEGAGWRLARAIEEHFGVEE